MSDTNPNHTHYLCPTCRELKRLLAHPDVSREDQKLIVALGAANAYGRWLTEDYTLLLKMSNRYPIDPIGGPP